MIYASTAILACIAFAALMFAVGGVQVDSRRYIWTGRLSHGALFIALGICILVLIPSMWVG